MYELSFPPNECEIKIVYYSGHPQPTIIQKHSWLACSIFAEGTCQDSFGITYNKL